MTSEQAQHGIAPVPWDDLRAHTQAHLALMRAGAALPTTELLRFGLAHAQARDAVHIPLDATVLATQLQALGCATYLLRPDLGRRLCDADARVLRALGDQRNDGDAVDLLLVVADSLSSLAVARQAPPPIDAIRQQAPAGWQLGPVVIARQARVALGDEVGALLGARLVAVLIGERPGLSSPDSLGIYLTWYPQVGLNDAQRNCISNVRPEGLPPRPPPPHACGGCAKRRGTWD